MKKTLSFSTLILSMFLSVQLNAQELTSDANTLLLLHFNNSVNGVAGEIPGTATGITYQSGIFGNGAYLDAGSTLQYLQASNMDETQGTFECWVKPNWDGSDGQMHSLQMLGYGGGMELFKNGNNDLGCMFNRSAMGGNPEAVAFASWYSKFWELRFVISKNNWFHVAYTWGGGKLKIYFNGILVAENNYSFVLPAIADNFFSIGRGSTTLDGVMDELRISNIARTDAEIAQSFTSGLSVSAVTMMPKTTKMFPNWSYSPLSVTAATNMGTTYKVPLSGVNWTSRSPAIAAVDANGKITAVSYGSCYVVASLKGFKDSSLVTVAVPVSPPDKPATIDPFLTKPADCAKREIPIVLIVYLPTTDGLNLDAAETGISSSIAAMKNKIETISVQSKFSLEEGSRFRGYKDASAEPFLGYKVVDYIYVYESVPRGFSAGTADVYYSNYNQILDRFNGKHYVDDLGVKEFWLFGYHYGAIVPIEFFLRSGTGVADPNPNYPTLFPKYNNSYALFNYNYDRGADEMVHDHGHHFEFMYEYVNNVQDGNTTLFDEKFRSYGRCGDTHEPPNTLNAYDYYNMTLVNSDIEDWKPAGGAQTPVNAARWGNLSYAWPYSNPPAGKTEAQWYIYWMQNRPGMANTIPNTLTGTNNFMTNWWEFLSDWDKVIPEGLGLYTKGMASFGACGCANSTINITSPRGSSLQWFTDAAATTPFYTGTTLTLTNLMKDSIFYAIDPALGQTIKTKVFVSVKPSSVASITASGSTTFCQGGSVTLTAGSASSYSWNNGATAQSITVSASGNYSVTVTNANGCSSSSSASMNITVNPSPAEPTITQNDSVLTSSSATGNQWYLNGVIISGATSQTYTAAINGSYTVKATNANGCSAISAPFNYIVPGSCCACDVDGDGAIGITTDVIKIIKYVGRTIAQFPELSVYDVDKDGAIGMTTDVVKVLKCVGQRCP